MNIKHDISELVGGTPLVMLEGFCKKLRLDARIAAKLEYLNPTGSVKDRAALGILRGAERRGRLKPGDLIVEPTSGNTGISLAALAACRGYRLTVTMPETASAERIKIIKSYGAEVIMTPASDGMKGAIEAAKQIAAGRNGFMAEQFDNPDNPDAHLTSTGPELWEGTDGKLDAFVCPVGTGGTFTGTARFLKSKNKSIAAVAVEPTGSPVLSGGRPGSHAIQGIGAGFIPAVLERELIDRVIAVSDTDAVYAAKTLAETDGIAAGISSGAALFASSLLAREAAYSGKLIAVILPDSADRYYSTALFD